MINIKVDNQLDLAKAYLTIINLTLEPKNRLVGKEFLIIAYALLESGNIFLPKASEDFKKQFGIQDKNYYKYTLSLRRKKWIKDQNLNPGLLSLKKKLKDSEHCISLNIILQ